MLLQQSPMADTASKASTNNTILVSVLGGVEIGLIALVGYFLSTLVGSADTANNLTKTVLPITGTLGAIVLLHSTLVFLFYL